MKQKDLYKILKLKRNASPEDIKQAYRKLVMKHHPDKNPGCDKSVAIFKEIQKAYSILSDPARKHRYDETGDMDDVPDNSSNQIYSAIATWLLTTVKGIVAQGGDVEREDMIKHIRTNINHKLKELEKVKAEVLGLQIQLKKMLDKFEEGQESVMKTSTQFHIDKIENGLKSLEEEEELHKQVLEFLKGVKYKHNQGFVIKKTGWLISSSSATW